jgi:hypothetical protein
MFRTPAQPELKSSACHVALWITTSGKTWWRRPAKSLTEAWGRLQVLECASPLCTLHGVLSHSGFRSVSDPTSQPHVTAIDRSAACYTCYAPRNGPTPPRLSIRLGSKVPA